MAWMLFIFIVFMGSGCDVEDYFQDTIQEDGIEPEVQQLAVNKEDKVLFTFYYGFPEELSNTTPFAQNLTLQLTNTSSVGQLEVEYMVYIFSDNTRTQLEATLHNKANLEYLVPSAPVQVFSVETSSNYSPDQFIVELVSLSSELDSNLFAGVYDGVGLLTSLDSITGPATPYEYFGVIGYNGRGFFHFNNGDEVYELDGFFFEDSTIIADVMLLQSGDESCENQRGNVSIDSLNSFFQIQSCDSNQAFYFEISD